VPSEFVAVIQPQGSFHGDAPAEHCRLQAVFHTETAAHRIAVRASASAESVHDPASGISMLLHGETYGNGSNTVHDLLQTYRRDGAEGIGRVQGSFVALVCDPPRNAVYVVTDRINSRKAYLATDCDALVVASSPALLHRDRFALDPVGIAWYVTHGTVYNYRTCFQNVRLLERASIHTLHGTGFTSRPYWTYSFHAPSTAADRELSEELGRLLPLAVERRLGGRQTIFLALSAGYDSAGLLGALGKTLRVPDVRCFSYAQGRPLPGSDEFVSAQMAKMYGYSHRIVQSFDGDVGSLLNANVRMGERTCEEIDAWIRMAADFGGAPAPVLIVGDECLGWTDYRLQSAEDALHAVQIAPRAWAAVSPRLMPGHPAADIIEGMRADAEDMIARCPATTELHDTKDFLYLDQRMPQTIMMWREFNAGRFIRVANPLLDYDILDFMQTVPTRLRRQKLLYRRTVRRIYPETFQFPRARFASAQQDARKAVYHERRMLEELLKDRPSRLDSIIDPGGGWEMLRNLPDPFAAEYPTLKARVRRRAAPLMDALGVKDAMRRYVRPHMPIAPVHQMVWRWLVLRNALATELREPRLGK